jgi:hypothetical protein
MAQGVATVYIGSMAAELQISGPVSAVDKIDLRMFCKGAYWKAIIHDEVADWKPDPVRQSEHELNKLAVSVVKELMESPVGIARVHEFITDFFKSPPPAFERTGVPGCTPLVLPSRPAVAESSNKRKRDEDAA